MEWEGILYNAQNVNIRYTKKCSGIQEKVANINDFVCKRCLGLVATSMEENITLDEDNIEILNKFAYLSDVISTEGGAQETVHSRIRSG